METVLGLEPIGEFFGLIIITLDFSKFSVKIRRTIRTIKNSLIAYATFSILNLEKKHLTDDKTAT